jgi:hypothetical protein
MRQLDPLNGASRNLGDDQAFLPPQFFMQKTGAKRLIESENFDFVGAWVKIRALAGRRTAI